MLPCPFCGAAGGLRRAVGGYYPTCLGKEDRCIISSGTYKVWSRARDAVTAWNKRYLHQEGVGNDY